MNRLILVGNGFDLAHGLKTSYKDFIDDFWERSIRGLNTSGIFNSEANDLFYFDTNNENIENYKVKTFKQLQVFFNQKNITINYENEFLKLISEKNNLQNWVDIENEYYQQLKDSLKPNILDLDFKQDILDFNTDFEEIKNLLIHYLNKIDKNIDIKQTISKNIISSFSIKDFLSKFQKEIINRIIKNCLSLNDSTLSKESRIFVLKLNEIYSSLQKIKFVEQNFGKIGKTKNEILHSLPLESLILNFNYTESAKPYINEFNQKYNKFVDYNISEIHIHGALNNSKNPTIFGFGDDVDKKYQEFEDLNDNKYLENFKSIAYLQTDNYKKFLEFVDSEEYQVFIFGHSCGISDRTMLNTIFEHDNCKSIKPFYHRKDDGTDNYTDLVQNISRNFNDKKKFRDRVVNKTYCEPLT